MIVGVFSQNVLFQYNTKHLKHTGGAKHFTDFLCIKNTLEKEVEKTRFSRKVA